MTERSKNLNTALGLLAIVFWSMTFGLARSLTEQLGTLTAAAAIYLLAGVIGCAYLAVVPKARNQVLRLPARHLVGRGSLFVAYVVCIYLAMGLADSRRQAIEAGLINYLWPGLTLLLSVPILKNRARPALLPGIVIAFAGAMLATTQVGPLSLPAFVQNLRSGGIPYALGLGAAVCWALYSNLSRRWGTGGQGAAIPVFVLASGLVLAGLRGVFPEPTAWSARAIGEMACMALFPALLAYLFWDAAMQRGRIVLVVALSHFAPLLSAVVASLYLGVPLGWRLWAACGLIIAGAAVCKLSVVERKSADEHRPIDSTLTAR
jgi:drug/metabolite transporter (DMT)-like permease